MRTRMFHVCINLSPRLGTVRGFWRKLHRTRTHAIATLSSSSSSSPVAAIIMHRTSRAKERSERRREKEEKGEKEYTVEEA